MKWHQFPEAVYLAHVLDTTSLNVASSILVDAVSFSDVESFLLDNLKGTSWEVATIEKTYVYGKMFGGNDGEHIDFKLGADLKFIETFHLSELDIAIDGDISGHSWPEIIQSVLRRNIPEFSKKAGPA